MTYIRINGNIDDITELDIPLNTQSIILSNNGITNIPFDFFNKFVDLELIELQNNSLTELNFEIGTHVTFINLDNNKLDRNAVKVKIPTTLETITVTGNPYHNFEELANAQIVIYGNVTQCRKELNNDLRRPNDKVQKVQKVKTETIKTETIKIDVHQTEVQNNIRNSITYLLGRCPNRKNCLDAFIKIYDKKYIRDNNVNLLVYIITKMCTTMEHVRLLKYYYSFDNDIIYDYEGQGKFCKMSDLLNAIYILIENHENRDNVLESLLVQMKDGEQFCFVGKYTRVLNSLTSFNDNITINDVSTNEKIGNKIASLKHKKMNITEIIKEVVVYMTSLKVSPQDQAIWIDALSEEE